MRSTSVQLVMVQAEDVADCAVYYVSELGFQEVTAAPEEVVLDGYGVQLVISVGHGAGLATPPPRAQAAVEISVSTDRMESVWLSDLNVDAARPGPSLDERGVFVYVTLDPAGNAVSLVAPLPHLDDEEPRLERITQRIARQR